jgi:hypothetical protein
VGVALKPVELFLLIVQLIQNLGIQIELVFEFGNFEQGQQTEMVIDGKKSIDQHVNPRKQSFNPQEIAS